MQRYGASKSDSGIGSSRITAPVSHWRLRCEYGSNEVARTRSSIPIRRRTFIELGIIWMPAPSRMKRLACSYTCTSKPARRSVDAAVRPPRPAPTMAMESGARVARSSASPANRLPLRLLLEPFLKRREVVEHRRRVHLARAGERFERAGPGVRHAHRQHRIHTHSHAL